MTRDKSDALTPLIKKENRKIIGEAALTFLVGIVTVLLVFGGVFWISYLFTWFLHPFGLHSPGVLSLIVTTIFLVISVYNAWRRHDPIEHVEAMDQTLQNLQLGAGYALGVPVLNRQSIAGFGSLFISGPANILGAWSLWRTTIRTNDDLTARAFGLLNRCKAGVPAERIPDPAPVALLLRLRLIKAVTRPGGNIIELQLTAKGSELLAASVGRR